MTMTPSFMGMYFSLLFLLSGAFGGITALIAGWDDRSHDARRTKIVFTTIVAGATLVVGFLAWMLALGIIFIAQAHA